MFNIAIGFLACAVLSAAFPKVGLKINEQATRLIKWGVELWRGKQP
jgi:hypothetical protein